METTDLQDSSYNIKISGFEGPLGLLLSLIEKRKFFINDLSLANVTEDYLKYVNELGKNAKANREEISSFIVVAATLILIKSKSLLPNLDLTPEEEKDIHDLEERLRLYKIFTDLSFYVKKTFGEKIIFAPLERKIDSLIFLPDSQITKKSMMDFARNTIGAMPKKIILPQVEVRKIISIEEMIDKLMGRIQDSIKISFKDFTGKANTREEKITVIVGFLAMLELVRNGIIHAVQEIGSDDIIIEKQTTRSQALGVGK